MLVNNITRRKNLKFCPPTWIIHICCVNQNLFSLPTVDITWQYSILIYLGTFENLQKTSERNSIWVIIHFFLEFFSIFVYFSYISLRRFCNKILHRCLVFRGNGYFHLIFPCFALKLYIFLLKTHFSKSKLSYVLLQDITIHVFLIRITYEICW